MVMMFSSSNLKGEVRMKLHSLLSSIPFAKITNNENNPDILSIEQDTREVTNGTLFICIEGTNYDGHDFAQEAIERGAVAIVSNRKLDVTVPNVIVHDTNRAMAILADYFYGHPSHSMYLIGVTGTNGKTSVTHIIQHIFKSNNKKTGLIGSLYSKIGDETFSTKNTTPDSLTLQKTYSKMLKVNTEVVTMEVSSHSLVNGRVLGSDFDVTVFTNLSQDHLDYHLTMEEYRNAKGLLFSRLGHHYHPKTKKFAVLNADDPTANFYKKLTAAHFLTYGIKNICDVCAENIQYSNKGTNFRIKTPIGNCDVFIPLIGEFNVYNTLAAITVGIIYGLPLQSIVNAISTFKEVPGRFELVKENQPFPVIVDYAHTPEALENVLKTVRSMTKGRVFAIVGCGGDRDRLKRPLMAKIACDYATDAVFTSDNPRSEDPIQILNDMEKGVVGKKYKVIVDRAEAIKYAIQEAGPPDSVIITGKGHETYQIIGDKVFDFDDREVARRFLIKKFNK